MAVSADGAPPGGAGAGAAGAPAAHEASAASAAQTSWTSHASPSVSSPPPAHAGAEDVLRTFVRSSVEKILKEAPWTFNKVNPLKEACREFLREVDAADGAREHHAVGSEPVPETGSVGEQQSDDDERKKKVERES